MEIKQIDYGNKAGNVNDSLAPAIQNSAATVAAIRSEQSTGASLLASGTNKLARDLKSIGEENAFLDAAKDDKNKKDYKENKLRTTALNTELTTLRAEQALTKERGEDTTELDKKLEEKNKSIANAELKGTDLKTAMQKSNLDIESNSLTILGDSYRAKARAIASNRMEIDLNNISLENYAKNKSDPTKFLDAQKTYNDQALKNIPDSMRTAWQMKVDQNNNKYLNMIYKKNKDTQDNLLAATVQKKSEITQLNLYDAADQRDSQAYETNLADTKDQLTTLEKAGIILPGKADITYSEIKSEAQTKWIMSSFKDQMQDNPTAAIKYFKDFSSKTSKQMFGDPKKTAGAFEYNVPQRDIIAAKMNAAINSRVRANGAANKKVLIQYNAKAKELMQITYEGKDAMGLTALYKEAIPGVNMDAAIYIKLRETVILQPQILSFKDRSILTQQAIIDKLETQEQTPQTMKELKLFKQLNKAARNQAQTDPGLYALNGVSEEDKPSFNEVMDGTKNISDYISEMEPYSEDLHNQLNVPKRYLSNDQANFIKSRWDDMGNSEKIGYVQDIYKNLGAERAAPFFEQMGSKGDLMEQVYSQLDGKSAALSHTILTGKEMYDNDKSLINNQKYTGFDATYNKVLNNRGRFADVDSKAEFKAAVMYSLIADNNGADAANITESVIKDKLNQMYGETVDTAGYFSTKFTVTIKNQDKDYFNEKLDNFELSQLEGIRFNKTKDGLTPEVLHTELINRRIQLEATGREGEYIMIRNDAPVVEYIDTGRILANGLAEMKPKLKTIQLWDPKL